jgi:serine/threonine protein kinase
MDAHATPPPAHTARPRATGAHGSPGLALDTPPAGSPRLTLDTPPAGSPRRTLVTPPASPRDARRRTQRGLVMTGDSRIYARMRRHSRSCPRAKSALAMLCSRTLHLSANWALLSTGGWAYALSATLTGAILRTRGGKPTTLGLVRHFRGQSRARPTLHRPTATDVVLRVEPVWNTHTAREMVQFNADVADGAPPRAARGAIASPPGEESLGAYRRIIMLATIGRHAWGHTEASQSRGIVAPLAMWLTRGVPPGLRATPNNAPVDALVTLMARVGGHTLGATLEHAGAMDGQTTLDIVAQLAATLCVAQAAGIYHGDITRNNIMLQERAGSRAAPWCIDIAAPNSPNERLATPGSRWRAVALDWSANINAAGVLCEEAPTTLNTYRPPDLALFAGATAASYTAQWAASAASVAADVWSLGILALEVRAGCNMNTLARDLCLGTHAGTPQSLLSRGAEALLHAHVKEGAANNIECMHVIQAERAAAHVTQFWLHALLFGLPKQQPAGLAPVFTAARRCIATEHAALRRANAPRTPPQAASTRFAAWAPIVLRTGGLLFSPTAPPATFWASLPHRARAPLHALYTGVASPGRAPYNGAASSGRVSAILRACLQWAPRARIAPMALVRMIGRPHTPTRHDCVYARIAMADDTP